MRAFYVEYPRRKKPLDKIRAELAPLVQAGLEFIVKRSQLYVEKNKIEKELQLIDIYITEARKNINLAYMKCIEKYLSTMAQHNFFCNNSLFKLEVEYEKSRSSRIADKVVEHPLDTIKIYFVRYEGLIPTTLVSSSLVCTVNFNFLSEGSLSELKTRIRNYIKNAGYTVGRKVVVGSPDSIRECAIEECSEFIGKKAELKLDLERGQLRIPKGTILSIASATKYKTTSYTGNSISYTLYSIFTPGSKDCISGLTLDQIKIV